MHHSHSGIKSGVIAPLLQCCGAPVCLKSSGGGSVWSSRHHHRHFNNSKLPSLPRKLYDAHHFCLGIQSGVIEPLLKCGGALISLKELLKRPYLVSKALPEAPQHSELPRMKLAYVPSLQI